MCGSGGGGVGGSGGGGAVAAAALAADVRLAGLLLLGDFVFGLAREGGDPFSEGELAGGGGRRREGSCGGAVLRELAQALAAQRVGDRLRLLLAAGDDDAVLLRRRER